MQSRHLSALLGALCSMVCVVAQAPRLSDAVHVGKGLWVTPAEASARGWFPYKDRWLPKRLKSKARRWERADAKVDGFSDAYRAKSKHYRIRTNAPRHVVELEVIPLLDELFDVYCEVFKRDFGLRPRGADHQEINIYWGYPSWRDEMKRTRGNPGFYVSTGELNVLYDPADPDSFYMTVFHEGAHQFFRSLLPGAALPTWLNEALAVYMEGCCFDLESRRIVQGHLPNARLHLAQQLLRKRQAAGESLEPEEVFMQYPQGVFNAHHYALAWSYVYFLVHREDGKHKKQFYKFLDGMNGAGARSVYEVFARENKADLHEIDKGWVPFVLGIQSPAPTQRMILQPTGSNSVVQDRDVLVSVNGRDVDGAAAYSATWGQRRPEQPATLVVRRRKERRGHMDYELELVRIEVPAGNPGGFTTNGAMPYTKGILR